MFEQLQCSKYLPFIVQAMKITFSSLIVVLILWLCGANNDELAVSFIMMVMPFAATAPSGDKHIREIFYAGCIIVSSIIVGGLSGYYIPLIAPWLVIVYAVSAFLLPKTHIYTSIFVLGALMFLVFSSLPFSWDNGWGYIPCGAFVIFAMCCFFWAFHRSTFLNHYDYVSTNKRERNRSALVVGIALVLAWVCSALLKKHTALVHLYWIQLTVLVVMLASQQKFIRTALLRIVANILGVFVIIFLMYFIIPNVLWVNLLMLVILLFLIFACGFSYLLRTLFISMFVLTFMHLAERYSTFLAIDRIYLTLIGSALVMLSFCVVYFIVGSTNRLSSSK